MIRGDSYEMPLIETILKKYGFSTVEQGKNKILLEKNES
jgi:hypothetical protein